MSVINYHQFSFKEIRTEINKTLNFINDFCFHNDIKNLNDYFKYKSTSNQIYPDALDHLMRMKLSPYYLIVNKAFISFYHSLQFDIRNDLETYYQFEIKKQFLIQNKYLIDYLKKILNKYFLI